MGVQQGDPLGPLLFSIVLHPLVCKIRDSFNLSFQAWYLDDGTIIGDTFIVGEVLKEDLRSRFAGVFLPNIARPLHGVKLLELLLLRACAGISKLYFAIRTCPPWVFERAQRSFDAALCSALERIVTASGLGFGDVLNYAFLASRLQSASLQTKLLRHYDIVTSGSAFDNALSNFNVKMKIDLLNNSSELAPRSLRSIFMEIMLSHVLVLLVSNINITLCMIPLLTSGPGPRFQLDGGLDVCVDLIGSSPLTQTGMIDFAPGRAVIEAAQRKRVKYETKCIDIGYGFHLFSFSFFGELEKDAVRLLKRIRRFTLTQEIGARAAVHIFNRIGFAIARRFSASR
ncbi:hypothetical protein Tco_0840759 [Tanacetum coccineum]|uniref:Reverse transcriptase domain-containing protein n=1 Tax=Tanacetum coccineum TaxID=301880 RepID=A0ABQ5AXZ3_9ASTR